MNRLQLQEQEVQQIHDNYARDLDRVDEIYEELADTIVIKLSQEPSAEKWAQKVTLIGEASSQQTKIIRYIFTEKENSEDINESEWKTPTGGSELDTLQYAWSQDNKKTPTEWQTFENGKTVIKEGITTEQSWYLCVQAIDKAGNTTIAWSEKFSVKIENYEIAATGEKTATLAEAIEKVRDSQIINVIKSNVDTSDVTIDKNVKINTNGKTVTRDKAITINDNISVNIYGNGTITSDNSSAILSNYGTLEIKNTNINLEDGGNAIYNEEGATLTVSGTSNISSNASYPTIHNFGITEITGGTITSNATYYPTLTNNGTAEIRGGEITSTKYIALSNNGTAEIMGGMLSSKNGNAIINYEEATLKIGGTSNITSNVRGYPTLYNYGTVEITGGTVTNTGGGYAIYNRQGRN